MPDPKSHKAFRAIVIAGSDIDQELYQEQLRSLSIDACATDNLDEAERLLDAVDQRNIHIDLIVIDCADVQSTHANFFIAALRMHPNFKNTIILTIIDDKTNKTQVSDNVDEILVKPVSPSFFEETVEKFLRTHADDVCNEVVEDTSSSGLDVLIAEDNDVNQIVFSEVLNDLGVNFKIAANGQEAVELWKAHNPAIVLMDISMPVMSGYEATKAIRAIEKQQGLRRTPICAITAHALKGDKEDCLVAGMDEYLSKPVSPDMMAQKISSMLPDTHPLNIKTTAGRAA